MYISFYEIVPTIKKFILSERPNSVLVIGQSTSKFVKFLQDILKENKKTISIDKLPMDGHEDIDYEGQKIYSKNALIDDETLQNYDCILVTDVIEYLAQDATIELIEVLLRHVLKSLLIITPLLTINQADSEKHLTRVYHPTLFKDFDFNFSVEKTIYGQIQFYSFFPQLISLENKKKFVKPYSEKKEKLRIGYILPHHKLTGGLKCLLEQMRQLHKRGHEVYAIYQGKKGDNAIPGWSDINLDHDINGQIIVTSLEDVYRLNQKVDVLLCGFISLIPSYLKSKIPLVYWEQGYELLYGDYGALISSSNEIRKKYNDLYHTNAHYLAVADIVSDILQARYNIESTILYNGIDLNFYKPEIEKKFTNTILLVGNPELGFKNFPFAFDVLNKVWALGGRFTVKWAGQVKPSISGLGFPVEFFEMVSQAELAKLYRTSDIFIFTSVYESFPMPPIEAMASGTPVISTDCGGINTYGKTGENCLIIDQGDVNTFAESILFLMQNESARKLLSENGLQTAKKFSFEHIVQNIEDFFYSISK